MRGRYRMAAVLAAIPVLCGAAAADNGAAPVTVLMPNTVTGRVLPETAPGGTVVLRGTPAVTPTSGPPAPGPANSSGPSGYGPAVGVSPREGWDPNYDTTGIDRRNYDLTGIERRDDPNYDGTGIDRNFDRTGLSRP
jgi:hypothetical protein